VHASYPLSRGARALRRWLGTQTFEVRGLDLDGFRRWLSCRLDHWRQDPVFVQRATIRDLRRAQPRLNDLEQQHHRAAAADARSPSGARLRQLEQQLMDAAKAVAGLTAAMGQAAADKRPALRQKLATFQARLGAMREEHAALLAASPQRQLLLSLSEDLQRLRSGLGLDCEEERLDRLLRQQGRRSGKRGEAFERLALDLTHQFILPDLVRRLQEKSATAAPRVLSGVTLGAARTEIDHLVVALPRQGGEPVDVLAMVEAKRNANDLAHGFRLRQENLGWLTGDSAGYDPGEYRTGYFRTGHFDRAAEHAEGSETFRFTRFSFRRFRRDASTGYFLDRLYFITRAGQLWGLSTAALGRIGNRVATDERWHPESSAYLRRLQRWCESLTEPIETPDVLRTYLAAPGLWRQVLVVTDLPAASCSGHAGAESQQTLSPPTEFAPPFRDASR
jgi:hypothetical protein